MPHPKRSLEQEERALANDYAEHARRLQRSQHPHFRHDLAPDVVETPLPAFLDHQKAPPGTWILIDPKAFNRLMVSEAPNTFRTRRRVTPR